MNLSYNYQSKDHFLGKKLKKHLKNTVRCGIISRYKYSKYLKREWLLMIKVNNHIGTIGVSARYLRSLISQTAESCFGVAGMNSYGAVQSMNNMVRRSRAENNGVLIRQIDNKLSLDLHITVTYGVNVGAITESIAHKVSYVLTERAGIEVESVNVFIDGLVD